MEEFTQQGFEIVQDEQGEYLVKLVFMVEGSEQAIEYLATPDEARKILSGELTIDPSELLEAAPALGEGQQIIADERISTDIGRAEGNILKDGSSVEAGMAVVGDELTSYDTISKVISNTDSLQYVQNMGGASSSRGGVESNVSNFEEYATQEEAINGVEFTITEYTKRPTSAHGREFIQVVILRDAQNRILDQKESLHGHKVTLHMNAQQSVEYTPQGPTENGEPIISTLILASGNIGDEIQEDGTHGDMGSSSKMDMGGGAIHSTGEALIQQQETMWCPQRLTLSEFRQIRQYAEEYAYYMLNAWKQKYTVVLYQEKMGSYTAYEQMTSLMNFDSQLTGPSALEQFRLMREHSALFRPAGSKSRPLTKCELGTNEAAAQLCRYHPPLMFYRRDLAAFAKQVMLQLPQQMDGMNVLADIPDPPSNLSSITLTGATPSSRGGNIQNQQGSFGASISPSKSAAATGAGSSTNRSHQRERELASESYPASSFPVGSGSTPQRLDSSYKLLPNEEDAIHSMALDIATEIPKYSLKSKSELNAIERFLFEDAERLTKLESTNQLHQYMDVVREVALLHGRHPNGHRNYSVPLTPFEVACNEAAAWLVSVNPALVTHRRDLSDYAKRVVKNCGYYFKHTPVVSKAMGLNGQIRYPYGSEYLSSGMDLSIAEMEFTKTGEIDPEMRMAAQEFASSPPSSSGVDESLSLTSAKTENDETLTLICEAENNIVCEVNILAVTGADDIRRVRRLDLSNCCFTGILPLDINRCVNLVELNLENNCLVQMPRCLYLPHLRRLNIRRNPFIHRPLVEQFSKLQELYIDDKFAKAFNPIVLKYFCPRLCCVNDPFPSKEKTVEGNEEETAILSQLPTLKSTLESHIQSLWDQTMAPYYKMGVPYHDAMKVIETLVYCVSELEFSSTSVWLEYKALLTRQVCQEFLNPKILDEEDDENLNGDNDVTNFHEVPEVDDSDDEAAQTKKEKSTEPTTSMEVDENRDPDQPAVKEPEAGTSVRRVTFQDVPSGISSQTVKIERVKAASVCSKEVASGVALLPEEPHDPLAHVIGEALSHGKCVVYSVMRTAARQPGSDLLIPVGGGTSFIEEGYAEEGSDSSDYGSDRYDKDMMNEYGVSREGHAASKKPIGIKRPPLGSLSARGRGFSGPASRRPGGMEGQGFLGIRRGRGRPRGSGRAGYMNATYRGRGATPIRQPTYMTSHRDDSDDYNSSEQYSPRPVVVRPQVPRPPTLTKSGKPRGRPPGRRSTLASGLDRASKAATEASVLKTKEIMLPEIPPLAADIPVRPHSPPPAGMGISTRITNRNKRFSQFGAVDVSQVKEDDIVRLSVQPSQEEEAKTDDVTVLFGNSSPTGAPIEPPSQISTTKRKRKWKTAEEGDSDFSIEEEESDVIEEDEKAALEMDAEERERRKQQRAFLGREFYEDEEGEPPAKDYDSSDEDFDIIAESAGMRARKRYRSSGQHMQLFADAEQTGTNVNDEYEFLGSDIDESEKRVRNRANVGMRGRPGRGRPSFRGKRGYGGVRIMPDRFRTLSELGKFVDYDPLHFIRCHARDNDPTDCSTKVWRCAFEPRVDNPAETTHIVATCGGECVCLVDCVTGKVMKRFKQQDEEFYAVAWTTVEMSPGHHTNLLAAAGRLKEIRLLHPEQLVCYALLPGHEEDIACMCFHPMQPTILFSGDATANILMWDIGVPTAPEYSTRYQLLRTLVCPRPEVNPVLNLVVLGRHDALLAGCEDGIFVWTIKDYKNPVQKKVMPDTELKLPTSQEPCFDGLAKISDNLVVTKCVEEGKIFLFDFRQILCHRKSVKSVHVEILGELRWQVTDEIYINVTGRSGLASVICGDNEGAIWIYDLKNAASQGFVKKFKNEPIKILEWPECSVGAGQQEPEAGTSDEKIDETIAAGFKNPVVNAADISSDGRFLCAVTDNNLVCVWKFSD